MPNLQKKKKEKDRSNNYVPERLDKEIIRHNKNEEENTMH
jgi:hypothetical protein